MLSLNHRLIRVPFAVGILFGTLACALTLPENPAPDIAPTETTGGAPEVVLSSPLEGSVYEADVPVNVLARVTNAGEDIDRVEITVDGDVVSSVPAPNPNGAPIFTVAQSWNADGNGPRTLALTVYRTDGTASDTAARTVQVVGDENVMAAAPANTTAPDTDSPATNSGGGVLSGLFNRGNTTTAPVQPAPEDTDNGEQAEAPPQPTTPPQPTAAPTNAPSFPSAVMTVGVNVRSGPGTAYDRIGSFAQGTETRLLGVTSDGSWYKLEYYNTEGWIAASLLDVRNAGGLPVDDGPPPPTATPTPAPTNTPAPTDVPANRNLTFDDQPQGFTPYPPNCGDTMAITLRLRNTGTESLGTTSAAVVRDIHIDSGTTTATTIPVPDIGPGETIEVTGGFLTVDTNFGSQHRIEIVLDANNEITESNEGDNLFDGGLQYTLEQGSC